MTSRSRLAPLRQTIQTRIMAGSSRVLEPAQEMFAGESEFRMYVDGDLLWEGTFTPGQEIELAAGRLLSEGLVRQASDIAAIAATRQEAWVELNLDPALRSRDLGHESSLGVATVPVKTKKSASAAALVPRLPEMMRAMQSTQRLFHETGATHCAALFDERGGMLSMAEDIARHNALDKAIGGALLTNAMPRACAAAVTSRLSGELARKCLNADIAMLGGVSAATSMAMELARKHGLFLIGRVRGDAMQVYAPADIPNHRTWARASTTSPVP